MPHRKIFLLSFLSLLFLLNTLPVLKGMMEEKEEGGKSEELCQENGDFEQAKINDLKKDQGNWSASPMGIKSVSNDQQLGDTSSTETSDKEEGEEEHDFKSLTLDDFEMLLADENIPLETLLLAYVKENELVLDTFVTSPREEKLVKQNKKFIQAFIAALEGKYDSSDIQHSLALLLHQSGYRKEDVQTFQVGSVFLTKRAIKQVLQGLEAALSQNKKRFFPDNQFQQPPSVNGGYGAPPPPYLLPPYGYNMHGVPLPPVTPFFPFLPSPPPSPYYPPPSSPPGYFSPPPALSGYEQQPAFHYAQSPLNVLPSPQYSKKKLRVDAQPFISSSFKTPPQERVRSRSSSQLSSESMLEEGVSSSHHSESNKNKERPPTLIIPLNNTTANIEDLGTTTIPSGGSSISNYSKKEEVCDIPTLSETLSRNVIVRNKVKKALEKYFTDKRETQEEIMKLMEGLKQCLENNEMVEKATGTLFQALERIVSESPSLEELPAPIVNSQKNQKQPREVKPRRLVLASPEKEDIVLPNNFIRIEGNAREEGLQRTPTPPPLLIENWSPFAKEFSPEKPLSRKERKALEHKEHKEKKDFKKECDKTKKAIELGDAILIQRAMEAIESCAATSLINQAVYYRKHPQGTLEALNGIFERYPLSSWILLNMYTTLQNRLCLSDMSLKTRTIPFVVANTIFAYGHKERIANYIANHPAFERASDYHSNYIKPGMNALSRGASSFFKHPAWPLFFSLPPLMISAMEDGLHNDSISPRTAVLSLLTLGYTYFFFYKALPEYKARQEQLHQQSNS